MDLLSDVLHVIRLTGALFFTARLAPPWAFRSPSARSLARELDLRPGALAVFHILVEGRCRITLDGEEPLELTGGSMIIFPHGDSHVLASRPGLRPKPLSVLLESATGAGVPQVEFGSGDDAARFLCGYFHCDQRFNPLIGALPRLLLADERGIRGRGRPVVPAGESDGPSGDWLRETLRFAVAEAMDHRPGSPAMLARLTELLFLEVLRRYSAALPAGESGWLAAVRDGEVGHALRLMHAEPGRAWTVDELAGEVGLSRSALASNFTAVVGQSPIRYLTDWRMQLAQRLLSEPDLSISQIARRVGYSSDPAFHRAFKRCVGQPPASWRRRARGLRPSVHA